MKKLLLLLFLAPIVAHAQMQFGTGVGIRPSWDCLQIGYKFKNDIGVKPIIGIGFGFTMGSPEKGKDYTGIINVGSFPGDLRDADKYKSTGFYLYAGIRVKRFEITGRLGMYQIDYYQNRHDPTHILSNSGDYYIVYDNTYEALFGGNIGYYTSKNEKFGVYAGYDNYNSVNVGIKYQF